MRPKASNSAPRLSRVRRADDHRLAAALLQPGQGRLVAHALGQADGVADGGFVVGVRQVATTTQCRPSRVLWMAIMALSPVAGSWRGGDPRAGPRPSCRTCWGSPACCLLSGRAVAAGTFSIGRRRETPARPTTRPRRSPCRVLDEASADGYNLGVRPLETGPGVLRTARPQRSRRTRRKAMDPRQACLDCLAQEPQRCSRRPCGSPRSTSRRIRRPRPARARRTRPADRRQPGRPRLGQRARPGVAAANERTGFLRRRRLPLQPRSACSAGAAAAPGTAVVAGAGGHGTGAAAGHSAGRSELPGTLPAARAQPTICSTRPPDGASIPPTAANCCCAAGAEERAASRLPEAGLSRENPPASVAQPATTAQRRRRALPR